MLVTAHENKASVLPKGRARATTSLIDEYAVLYGRIILPRPAAYYNFQIPEYSCHFPLPCAIYNQSKSGGADKGGPPDLAAVQDSRSPHQNSPVREAGLEPARA